MSAAGGSSTRAASPSAIERRATRFGLCHYESKRWRGSHHPASLSIVARVGVQGAAGDAGWSRLLARCSRRFSAAYALSITGCCAHRLCVADHPGNVMKQVHAQRELGWLLAQLKENVLHSAALLQTQKSCLAQQNFELGSVGKNLEKRETSVAPKKSARNKKPGA